MNNEERQKEAVLPWVSESFWHTSSEKSSSLARQVINRNANEAKMVTPQNSALPNSHRPRGAVRGSLLQRAGVALERQQPPIETSQQLLPRKTLEALQVSFHTSRVFWSSSGSSHVRKIRVSPQPPEECVMQSSHLVLWQTLKTVM